MTIIDFLKRITISQTRKSDSVKVLSSEPMSGYSV